MIHGWRQESNLSPCGILAKPLPRSSLAPRSLDRSSLAPRSLLARSPLVRSSLALSPARLLAPRSRPGPGRCLAGTRPKHTPWFFDLCFSALRARRYYHVFRFREHNYQLTWKVGASEIAGLVPHVFLNLVLGASFLKS